MHSQTTLSVMTEVNLAMNDHSAIKLKRTIYLYSACTDKAHKDDDFGCQIVQNKGHFYTEFALKQHKNMIFNQTQK